jgi:O-acetylhomoserine (thiol)-lyase
MRFSTRAIHSGYEPAHHGGALQTPVYATAAYAFSTSQDIENAFAGRSAQPIYSRISNPTTQVFERRIAVLEEGVGALACASGMAAITTVALTLLSPGDRLVSGKGLFGGTVQLFEGVLSRFGVEVCYVDASDPGAVEAALNDRTGMVFLEALGNPSLAVPDFDGIGKLCAGRHIPVVVDSTLLTPALFVSKTVGAAVVVHSTTKYITGSGSAIGGVIVDTGTFDWRRFRGGVVQDQLGRVGPDFAFLAAARQQVLRDTGASQGPFDASLQLLGLETLELRMERHCRIAEALARLFRERGLPVRYPDVRRSNPSVSRYFPRGAGGLLAVQLGTEERARKLIDGLEIASIAANIGEARTLVIHPWSTIYRNVSEEQKAACGVTRDLVRVCTGLEDPEDIVEDFATALAAL